MFFDASTLKVASGNNGVVPSSATSNQQHQQQHHQQAALLNQLQRQSLHRSSSGNLFAMPGASMNSTEELNQYNQALNALQSMENQFDLGVEEFLNDEDMDDQPPKNDNQMYFDASLYSNGAASPQLFGNNNQFLHNAHNTVLQHNKLLQSYLTSMTQQQAQLVSQRHTNNMNSAAQVAPQQQQQPQNGYKNNQNSNIGMTNNLPQQTTSKQSTNSSSALSNFGAMISTMTGGYNANSQVAPPTTSTPISSSSSSNQVPSTKSTKDSNSRSSASPPTTQFFPTLDKGINAVQQVIVNGGITNVQIWSNCLMQLIPVLKIMDDNIPETIIGGKSVSNRKKTPLTVSIEVSVDRFRMLVSTIINMIRTRNSILEKDGDAFCQVSEKLNLTINLEDLKNKVQRNETTFSDDLWRADVSLLMSSQEQDKGLTRDKPKKKKSENSREGFSVFSNPENPATTIIQYAPIKAGIVSNNKKNCHLRYKLCYDNWLTYYVDSTKLFAINCGKNTKTKRKSKGGEDIGKDEEDMDELSNNGDNSPPSSPVPNNNNNVSLSSIVPPNQPGTKEKLTRSSSTASLGSSSSNDKPQTVAVASNGSFIVSPKSGSNAGGYLIFIQCNFDSRLITDLQEVKVFLGDQEVEIKQINQNAIFVMAPQTDFKGEVPIEIRTSNFSVSNPQDLKFEFLDDTSSNIMVGETSNKKRKFVECCDGECGPVSLNSSASSNSIGSSNFNPTAISLSNKEKKKKRKESSTPYRREWAIVIAIDKYHHNGLLHQSSASSVHDAMNISNILSKIYGFEVRLLLNEEATWSKVNQLFVSLAESDSLQNDDAILIFFTGVSLSKQYNNGYTENYLALYDTDPDNLVNTAISHQSFVNFHHRLAAKHTLFIFDTFYNGILMKVVNDNHPSKDMKYYSSNKAVQIICSSQKSYGMKPGVFSKELVNLLTTLKWGSSVKGHLTLTPFYTASDLGKQLQTKVHKETGGVQVPRFGEVELGGGNFLFIPKSYEKHSYNSELERIVSLLSLYEDYIQNMNLGDMHKHESLMALLKVKFFQISNYYLQTFEKLINEEKIELRSDVYTNHKLNLTEIIKTVRHSYLALYRWTGEWILHNPYHLADANKKLLDNNPGAVVKRIFVVGIPNMSESEEKEYFKLMHYNHSCGIEVRVVQHKDLDDRKEIPHNFSILDSRLGHYLSFEDDYPKSVIIFNRKSVADLYYSKWVYVYNHSTPFEEYVKEKFPEGVELGDLTPSTLPSAVTTYSETKQCHPLCNTDHTVSESVPPSSTLYQDKNMSLTDPLLSFDIHENIETLQICLDPLLQGFKKKFLEMINTPKDKHARHCGKCLLLQKFHSISMHYENQITTFFSKGEIVVHANFYDSMRLRLHDIQEYVEKSHHMIIPIHSWTVANSVQSPYFTQESVLEVADMNKRVKERNPSVTLECIFVFHKKIFEQSQDNVTSQQIISGAWIEENNLSKHDIISGLKYYRDCGIRVMVTFLDTIEEVKETVPGSYSIIDGKVCGSTVLSIEPSKCSGTHAFYMNAIDGGESNVKQNKELFENLRQLSIPLDDFLAKYDAFPNEAARAMMEDSK